MKRDSVFARIGKGFALPFSLQLLRVLLLTAAASRVAAEQLEIHVRAEGIEYGAVQIIDSRFEQFESGALSDPEERNVRPYQAVRCDGTWGAMKYQVTLASGPGYTLERDGDNLLLQIVEHKVLSKDHNIQAMKIHCQDLEPRTVVHAVELIELKRGKKQSRELILGNGYQVHYQYQP